jgi:hypothetical protein
MTWATLDELDEWIDDWAAEHPLQALREGFAGYLSAYRLDACATAEPIAALVHAYDLLTPERRAWCLARARDDDLARFIPDRIAPERRAAIRRREGQS